MIMLLTMVASTIFADDDRGLSANQRTVGYTVTDNIDLEGVAFGEAGTYTIGATMSASTMEYYKGCKIVGIRLAASMDLGRLRVFLDKIADRKLEEAVSQKQRIYKGWNNIFFNGDGIEITGAEGFFFGYDYVETEEMVAADLGGICCVGESTDGSFNVLSQGQLYEVTNVGKLCIQLIVDVTNMPAHKVAISYFDTGFKYKKKSEQMEIFSVVQNVGRDEVTTCRMAVSYDGEAPTYVDFESAIPSGQNATWQYAAAFPAGLGIGSHTLSVWVDSIDGEAFGEGTDHKEEVRFAIYENSISRERAYVEVYDSQAIPDAPYMHEALAGMVSDMGEYVSLVSIPSAGQSLGVDDSARLHDLYAYTVPSFTVNRSYFPGERYIAYDFNDFFGVLPTEFISGILEDIVTQDFGNPCFAGLDMESSIDAETRRLKVRVSGDVLPEAEAIYGDMALTLMLVEDGVVANQAKYSKMGNVSIDKKYVHDNVLREYLTAPDGTTVKVANGKYSEEYEYVIPGKYDASRMRVVALLTKKADTETGITRDNLKDYDVINSQSVDVNGPEGVSGVDTIESEAMQGGKVYGIDGVRRAKTERGLNIVNGRVTLCP